MGNQSIRIFPGKENPSHKQAAHARVEDVELSDLWKHRVVQSHCQGVASAVEFIPASVRY